MSFTYSRRIAAPLVAAAILLAGCGESDTLSGEVVEDGLGCQPTQVDLRTGEVPTVEAVAEAPAEVAEEDLDKGTGCSLDAGAYVTLDLVGATATDAKVFTNTFEDERPITASLGSGQLLAGLETGLEGMKVGGRRQITLPAADAYGAEGNPAQGIGPDQALIFVVDLVAVTDGPAYCNAATEIPPGKEGSGKPTEVEMPLEAPTGEVVTTDLTEGTGDPVEEGDYVTLHYLGVSCSTGRQFDSSWDTGEPFPVTLGEGTIPGFSTGIVGMKAGGQRRIEIPAAQGYGAQGQPPDIGPNDPLVFVISVLEAADEPPASTTLPTDTTAPAGDASTTVPGDASTTTAPAGEATTTTGAGDEPPPTTAVDGGDTTTSTTEP
ncbi:MAG TPA: FKBP-type peptidyl-prolyl cis-trans isomerase [Aquihabitans sp.]|jgi:peptidylprolyl isomerase|nr:FKBP-type peptidyl-prolyl cis-trans isomerase [Aquihabitans sp.]